MFTIEQIHTAHSKVKSGADFPKYIQDLISLWIQSYTIFVIDGHWEYNGSDDYSISSKSKYDNLQIANITNKDEFIIRLKLHQQWQTDYITFCNDAAKNGIPKRVMNLDTMECLYYDIDDNCILVEQIPST